MAVLIAIEGIDGSGKGTQCARLTDRLHQSGLQAASVRFPRYTATQFGQAIGDFLNGRFGELDAVHPQLAAVLYAGDRFESRTLLQNRIDTSDVVVLDRFTGSNLAHQASRLEGRERDDLMAWIEAVEHDVFGLPRPDLNVLLDISADWSRRLVGRKDPRDYTDQEADLQESNLPYLERVRRCYREIAASRPDWTVVPCLTPEGELRSVAEIGEDVFAAIRPLLPNHSSRTN